jgi:hypothetical protein
MSQRFKARDWESNEFEEWRAAGKPIVVTFGNPNKCALCDNKPTKLAHCWTDDEHVTDMYVCEEHWKGHVLREFDAKVIKYSGYRKLVE